MKIETLLQTLGTIITLATAAFMLYRARKMLPAEQSSTDADAAKKYAEAAKLSADQVVGALNRIAKLEKQSIDMLEEVEGLQEILAQRDKCIASLTEDIRRRDDFIADLLRGIKILIAQLQKENILPEWTPRDWRC